MEISLEQRGLPACGEPRALIVRLMAVCFALFTAMGSARAHSGCESETEIRLYPDKMRILVRTTFLFAWRILGEQAPRDGGEAARESVRPLLAGEGPALFEVSTAGAILKPRSSKCVYELDEHVVFLMVFDRPDAWPLSLRARFFEKLDPLTTGSVRLFDQTDDPYRRDVAAVAKKSIQLGDPGFDFDPAAAAEKVAVAADASRRPVAGDPPQASGRGRRLAIWLASVAVLFLILRAAGNRSPG